MTLAASGLTGGEYVGSSCFNLVSMLNPASLVFSAPTKVGSFSDPTISKGTDGFKADGDGYFDVLFEFGTSAANRFGAGDSVSYTITLAGLSADSFDAFSAPGGGEGQWPIAAHIQSIGGGSASGWVSGPVEHGSHPPIPEPVTMFSVLAALSGLGAYLRRRAEAAA